MRYLFVPPAPGITIAFFMLLAAMVTPQAPAGGVGLRAGLAARASAPAALTPSPAAARERRALPSCDGRAVPASRQIALGAAGACLERAGASSADAARRQAE